MKIIKKKIKILLAVSLIITLLPNNSCVKDLLFQPHTTEISSELFWKTEDDAKFALYGAYYWIRPCFSRDYYFDGLGETMHATGTGALDGPDGYMSAVTPVPISGGGFNGGLQGVGSSFARYYQYLYAGINHTNYVIDNVRDKMLPEVNPNDEALKERLEAIIGEARLLRGLCYFRLISFWGDVPGIWNVVNSNAEVALISRSPIAVIKDSIIADFSYAAEKLPDRSGIHGRMSKPAAIAMRGKMNLYWASWKNFGWTELRGFTQDKAEAKLYYAAAAADFLDVAENPAYGAGGQNPLQLFRNGAPGECDPLGKAENLPNYYYLFTSEANGDDEFLFYFTHSGVFGGGQGEELLRVFAGRAHEGSQGQLVPHLEIVNRYQSIITGDYCEPYIMINENDSPEDRIEFYEAENSAGNPKTYENRDYRMKSTLFWNFERSRGFNDLIDEGWNVYLYAAIQGGRQGTVSDDDRVSFYGFEPDPENRDPLRWNFSDRSHYGLLSRKFVRNTYGLRRSEGDYNWPMVRLADVYLMYAEASNFAEEGPNAKAIELVNRVRARGALPPLLDKYTTDMETFFKHAVEQERVIELMFEGHRSFDIRRWRKVEEVWGPPYGDGRRYYSVWGVQRRHQFNNRPQSDYQRAYIFQIPQIERDRNPNLSQNDVWN